MLETKDFKFSELIAEAEQPGTFRGLASVYNVVDLQNDVVLPGAFGSVTGSRVKILNQHNQADPIGFGVLEDGADALRVVEGKLELELPSARDTWIRMRAGLIDGLSIGYETSKSRFRKDGVRELMDVRLWEVSLVTFPANSLTRVSSVKHHLSDANRRCIGDAMSALKGLLDSAEEKIIVRRGDQWCVLAEGSGETLGCHDTREDALAQLRAIEANKARHHGEIVQRGDRFCIVEPDGSTAGCYDSRAEAEIAQGKEKGVRMSAWLSNDPWIETTWIAAACPSCGDKLKTMGVTRVRAKQIPAAALEGLCAHFGPDEGFRTRCMASSLGAFDPADQAAFCNFLEGECRSAGHLDAGPTPEMKTLEDLRAAIGRLRS